MYLLSLKGLVFFFFVFHVFLVYLFSFRFLNFLVSVEISLLFSFFFFVFFSSYVEVSYILVFLSLVACGVATGLSVMVSWIRYSDKKGLYLGTSIYE